jgi:hypothetical protein
MDHSSQNDAHLHKARKCSACRERDVLTSVAFGFAKLCRHCLRDTELVGRLEQAALAAGFTPDDQLDLF